MPQHLKISLVPKVRESVFDALLFFSVADDARVVDGNILIMEEANADALNWEPAFRKFLQLF